MTTLERSLRSGRPVSELAARRTENAARPIFADIERRTGITRSQVVDRTHSRGDGGPCLLRDEVAWRLAAAGVQAAWVGWLIGVSRTAAIAAVGRHEARVAEMPAAARSAR
jgi:hypothetical protein